MPDLSSVFSQYKTDLAYLSTFVDDAYNAINTGDYLKLMFKDSEKVLYIRVDSKSPNYSGSDMYDFNIIGQILEITQLSYPDSPKTVITYNNNLTYSNIMTKNTPESTDDPFEVYRLSDSELQYDLESILDNFYL